MRIIGIVRENEIIDEWSAVNPLGKPFKELINTTQEIDNIDRVLSYLRNGKSMGGKLLAYEDPRGEIISSYYLTDVNWIWPNYLFLYLNKYKKYEIPIEFLNHIKELNYVPPQVTEEAFKEMCLYQISIYSPEEYNDKMKKLNKLK